MKSYFSGFFTTFAMYLCIIIVLASCVYPPPPTTPTPTTISASLTLTPVVQQYAPSGTINIEGEKRFLFGANYPWHSYGHDFGENAWGHDGVSAQRSEVDADFSQLSAMGVQVVRWFVFADGEAAPDFANDGSVSGLDDKVFADLDAALEIAQAHKIHLILVLLDFHWMSKPETVNGVTKGGHADIVLDSAKRDTFYQQALLPLLKRYGDNPYILAWEVMNEPEWAIDDANIKTNESLERVPLDAMQNFVSDTTSFIHKNAKQWVTLGSASRRWWAFWENAGLNLCQFHYYDWMEKDSPLDFPYTGLKTNLPCIVGEFPTTGSSINLDSYYKTILKNGYSGAFPWSLRAGGDVSDLAGQSQNVQLWAKQLQGYIDLPIPNGWIPPTPLPTPTGTATPMPTITPDANITPDSSQYGFEKLDSEWVIQTDTENLSVMDIHRVYRPAPVYSGQYALQLNVNLIVGDSHLGKGEVFVDVVGHPPLDESVGPYDLSTKAITCWVNLPAGAIGQTREPWIAFQVFAKDSAYHSEYGTWTLVKKTDEGNWVRIDLKPRPYAPKNGYIDKEGFNPKEVSLIGVKIGADEKITSAPTGTSYTGPVYIDACTWK